MVFERGGVGGRKVVEWVGVGGRRVGVGGRMVVEKVGVGGRRVGVGGIRLVEEWVGVMKDCERNFCLLESLDGLLVLGPSCLMLLLTVEVVVRWV